MPETSNQIVHPAPVPATVDIPIVLGLNTLSLAILGFLGKWAFERMAKHSDRDRDRLDREIQELKEIQASFADTYVRRDDFVRAMVSVDNKLDAIAKRQDEQFHMILDRLGKG